MHADMSWCGAVSVSIRHLTGDGDVQGFELIFYGDSITEDWRGTSGGVPWPIGSGGDAVFKKHFSKYQAEVLAIAGACPVQTSLYLNNSCGIHMFW